WTGHAPELLGYPDRSKTLDFLRPDPLNKYLHGKQAVLTWMFLTEMWKCALEIGNAGRVISWWFKHYCAHHGVSPDVLNSLRDDHSGLGAAEKEEDRRERLFRDKVEQLATDLWERPVARQVGHCSFSPPPATNSDECCSGSGNLL